LTFVPGAHSVAGTAEVMKVIVACELMGRESVPY
jgi:hypothetical protein